MTATPALLACGDRRTMEYVYEDGDGVILLDPDTEVLLTVPHEQAGDVVRFLRGGERVHVLFQEGQPSLLEPPVVVQLEVTDTDTPAASATMVKSALLETGLKILVPAAVRIGETIMVDTRSGAYLGKAQASHVAP